MAGRAPYTSIMYALDIICSNGHQFESWFQNRAAFEEQQASGLVSCPICGDTAVKQVISAVRIGRHGAKEETAEVKKPAPSQGAKILDYIEKNFEDVGSKFPDEALKIHLGETDRRGIRGTATPQDEKDLQAEGVPFFKLPNIQ